jgi:hypothetical protein
MARKFLVSVDLNKNELINARIHHNSGPVSNPVTGQVYYDTSNNTMYYYNGLAAPNGPWMPMSGSTEVIQDVIGSSVIGGTGLTATYVDSTGLTTIDLDNTTVTAGSYGSQTKIPTFTVDAQGRLTAAGEVDVATTLTISDDTSATIGINLLTETLEVNGGEGIDVAVTGDSIVISAEDATSTNKGVASFDSTDFTVTSGAVTLNAERVQDIVGDMVTAPNTENGISVVYDDLNGKLSFDVNDPTITLSGDVTGSATMTNLGNVTITTTVAANSVELGSDTTGNYVATISGTDNEITVSGSGSETAAVTIGLPDNVTITGDLLVGGDLNVTGTINSVNTTTVNIVDNKINLNTDFTGTPVADAGIRVERGDSPDVEILWNESTDSWTLTNNGTNYHAITRKYVETLSTSATSYTVTHNLGTADVLVQISETASPYAKVEADVELTSTSAVTIKFATAPSAGEYKVVVIG